MKLIYHKVVVKLTDGTIKTLQMETSNGIPKPKGPGQTPEDAERVHVETEVRKSLEQQGLALGEILGWQRVVTGDEAEQQRQDAATLAAAQKIIEEGKRQREQKAADAVNKTALGNKAIAAAKADTEPTK